MLTRKRVAEIMDDPALDFASHAEALRGLEQLNIVSTSAASIWKQIEPLAKSCGASKLRILDIATGGGDIPISLFEMAQKDCCQVELVGADISPDAIEYARERARLKKADVEFMQLNALVDTIPEGFDVVMTNLFTHHLDPPEVISLLARMGSAARQLVLVNDLVRSEISYALVWIATRLFSRSRVVQYDGPVSVQGSYTSDELKNLAIQAGLSHFRLVQSPPCRQILVWHRSYD